MNIGQLATQAAEMLKQTPGKAPPATPQNGGAAPNPAGWSGAQNFGRNSLLIKLNGFNSTGTTGKPNSNAIADQLDHMADTIGKNHKGPMRFLGFNTKLSLLRSSLTALADILRKDDKSEMERVAADYYGRKNQGADPSHATSFNPSFDEMHCDFRAMPDLRIDLMKASGWQDNHLTDMKQSIDKCLKDMQSPNPQIQQMAIANFNNSSYPEHCGRMPGAAADYALLSNTIGARLAQRAASG
jgi:hypothetical protein